MPHGEFDVSVTEKPDDKGDAHGLDDIEFRVQLNPGQPFAPLARAASGGELSRISLAIQVIMSESSQIPTLIFDEVATGFGRTGTTSLKAALEKLGFSKCHHMGEVAKSVRQTELWQAIADGEPVEARIVVIGDSDFATNEILDGFRNRDFFVNSVNWLVGDVDAISIRPNTSRASRFQLSSQQFMRIQYLALFVIPETIAIAGVFAWWTRRRNLGN